MIRDLGGKRFGRLLVVKMTPHRWHRAVLWECYCDPAAGGCGKTKLVPGQSLKSGGIRSCGCLRRETARRCGMKVAAIGQKAAIPYLESAWIEQRRAAEERKRIGKKRCSKCGRTKTFKSFNRSSKALDGRQGWCNACRRDWKRNHRRKKKEIESGWVWICKKCDWIDYHMEAFKCPRCESGVREKLTG